MGFNPNASIDNFVSEQQHNQEQVIERVFEMLFVYFLPAIFNGLRRLTSRSR